MTKRLINKSKQNSEETKPLEIILFKKGGETSANIIDKLLNRPYNLNQLATVLNISYNTVDYHIKIMMKYELVEKKGENYGSLYDVTSKLLDNVETFNYLKELL